MAFLRFTRDKRGYEHFYLVEATTNRRGRTRARVLYWFRTPPGIKMGREPFDADVRRALELQNPGVQFDWRKIIETPIPSADSDQWRERRRLERAERIARRGAELEEAQPPQPPEASGAPTDLVDSGDLDSDDLDSRDLDSSDLTVDAAEQQADALAPTEDSLVSTAATIETQAVSSDFRKRRRRRRRRGRVAPVSPPGEKPGDV